MALPNVAPPVPLTPPSPLSTATNLAQGRFDSAMQYASSMYQSAASLLSGMSNFEVDIPWEPLELVPVSLGGLDGLEANEPEAPLIDDMVVPPVEFIATSPEFTNIDISSEDPPPFDVAAVDFGIPDAPNVEWPILSATEPTVSDIPIPATPQYTLPPVPVFTPVSIPSAPEFSLPTFDASLPIMDLEPPALMYVWNEAEYSSEVRDRISSKLILDIVNGGTGLNAITEQAIYDRAVSRQEDELDQQLNEAMNLFASRGFSLPPGALNGIVQEARNKVSQIRVDLNRDILIQQSNLAQKNTHFVIEQAINFEKMLTDHANQIQTRAFESAKFVAEAAITVFRVRVEAYAAQMEGYKAQAQVYESRIRGEIARAELYKAQIEGLRLATDIQLAMVEVYKAQIGAVGAMIDLYRAEMEGAKVRADIERTRIEIFRSIVDSYVARVGAVTARYNAYQAQIAGESEKVKMYGVMVDAYTSRVAAYKARADIDLTRVQSQVEQTKAEVEIYKAEISRYESDIKRAVAQAEIIAKEQEYRVMLYDSENKKYGTELDNLAKIYMGRIEEKKAEIEMSLKDAEMQLRVAEAQYEVQAQNTRSLAQAAAQIAAASISSVSASTHVGFSESRADSTSMNVGMSSSANTSASSNTSVSVSTININNS